MVLTHFVRRLADGVGDLVGRWEADDDERDERGDGLVDPGKETR